MAVLSSWIPDAALTLRPSSAGPITATTAEPAMPSPFPLSFIREATVMVSVMAMDASSGNESYVWSVQAAETIGGTYRTIATMARAAADGPGTFVIPLGRDDARILGLPNSVFLRIVATLAGTSPSVDYAAWITQASRGSTTTLG